MTEDQIKFMVDRFLGWKLPRDTFNPDCGISFKKTFNDHLPQPTKNEPSGTNLFDATQADAMVRYMVEGIAALRASAAPEEGMKREESAAKIIHEARKVYENHVGDGAWLAMERAYFDLISAALSPSPSVGTPEMPSADSKGAA